MSKCGGTYGSPRWTGELPDCSLPVTFDQYGRCSFRCMYCFAFFQKSIGLAKDNYLAGGAPTAVNPASVIRTFEEAKGDPAAVKKSNQFAPYLAAGRAIQWGGMADPFDPYEKAKGVGLEVLRYLRKENRCVSFSTKAVWWLADKRYVSLFEGARNFHVKISIITDDEDKAKAIELGVPTVRERILAMRRLKELGVGGITLRFRPFIVGISTPGHVRLIERAAEAGADSVSTEFFCLERRSATAAAFIERMSRVAGYDISQAYIQHSGASGYLRLNRKIKLPFWFEMQKAAHEHGMRFHVSDAHGKDFNDHGSCCGCPDWFPHSRAQFTEAIVRAKANGTVRWSEFAADAQRYFGGFLWRTAVGFNTGSAEHRAARYEWTMYDWLHQLWNDTKSQKGVVNGYAGVLQPQAVDENGDIIYRYIGGLQ